MDKYYVFVFVVKCYPVRLGNLCTGDISNLLLGMGSFSAPGIPCGWWCGHPYLKEAWPVSLGNTSTIWLTGAIWVTFLAGGNDNSSCWVLNLGFPPVIVHHDAVSHAHTYTHTHTHTRTCTHIHTNKCAYTRTQTHLHTHARHTLTQTHLYVQCKHSVCVYAHIHTHVWTQTHITHKHPYVLAQLARQYK